MGTYNRPATAKEVEAFARQWRDNLKKGDHVLIAAVYHPSKPRIVHRTTPSLVIVRNGEKEYRYLKKNGRRLGPCSGWIEPFKP